jgi:hypothetical protein
VKEWPAYKTARDLASGKVFPVSEAVILQTARKHGIGRKMGRAVIFSPEDCENISAGGCPHVGCRDNVTVVSHQRYGGVVWARHRII